MRKVTHFEASSPLFSLTITSLRGELVILLRVYRDGRTDTPVELPVLITCFSSCRARAYAGANRYNYGDVASSLKRGGPCAERLEAIDAVRLLATY